MIKEKIYLLYPPISKQERYSSGLGDAGGEQIPLGVFYLASFLKKNGFQLKVTDAEAEKLTHDEIINEIKEYQPSFIGISSTTVAFHRALEIAKIIKNKFKDVIIILGGPHISSNVKHAMSFKEFDYGVLREGEITFLELLTALINKKNFSNIKGIVYRKGKKLIITPQRDYIKNLDELPFPAYEFIKNINIYKPPPANYKKLPAVSMITSRGCPYQCTFCDKNTFGQFYRERSAINVFREIKYLYKKFKIKEIAFSDDTFLINKRRIYELFKLLNKENINFNWTCMARVNNVDYEFLKFLKEHGCWRISFGIESGDSEILKKIKKNISLDQVEKVINWCNKLKIQTTGFFMIGHPGDTLETINKTIKFACKLKLDNATFTINTPIPGSPQYAEIKKFGTLDETDWSQFNYWRPVFIPNGLTRKLLLAKQKEACRKFFWRPTIILKFILSLFGQGGFKRFKSLIKLTIFLFKKIK